MQLYPEWRAANSTTNYPFADRATLINAEGRIILEGLFLDAALYPIGGQHGLHLSKVTITNQDITLTIGDNRQSELASGTFALIQPPDTVSLIDNFGRPAGVIISESARLQILQSWGVGEHVFTLAATEFVATVCMPTPEIGLRGIMLEDGSLCVGDVWLVGEAGVIVREEFINLPTEYAPNPYRIIRIDVVGDPLFRRRLCEPPDLFVTPRFIKTIRVKHDLGEFICTPDACGDFKLAVGNNLAVDTVLRIRSVAEGIIIECVGETLG